MLSSAGPENHHILVWTANLADNMGFKDQASGLVVPKLLDDNFDTDYIQCHAKPYTAGMNEATYFLQGALSEWDTIEAVSVPTQYLDPSEPDSPDPLHIEGFVRRVTWPIAIPAARSPKMSPPDVPGFSVLIR